MVPPSDARNTALREGRDADSVSVLDRALGAELRVPSSLAAGTDLGEQVPCLALADGQRHPDVFAGRESRSATSIVAGTGPSSGRPSASTGARLYRCCKSRGLMPRDVSTGTIRLTRSIASRSLGCGCPRVTTLSEGGRPSSDGGRGGWRAPTRVMRRLERPPRQRGRGQAKRGCRALVGKSHLGRVPHALELSERTPAATPRPRPALRPSRNPATPWMYRADSGPGQPAAHFEDARSPTRREALPRLAALPRGAGRWTVRRKRPRHSPRS